MRRISTAAMLAALTAACSPSGEQQQPASTRNEAAPAASKASEPALTNQARRAPAEAPALALASDGLSLAIAGGSSRPVPFGTAEEEVIRIVAASLGQPTERGVNNDCGAGPLGFANFPGGLNLMLDERRFAGWFMGGDNAALLTVAGIGIGSTRRELDAAYQAQVAESTLGQEFTAGELGGILSSAAPDGRVEAIWAGTTCLFR